MRPIACFSGLAVLAFMAVSGCSGPQTCSSDADCPTGSTCDVELSACFVVSEEDAGTDGGEPDAGNSDAGGPDAGEPDAGVATFTLGVTPENPEVVQGESVELQVAIERLGGFDEDVEVTLEGLPSGMSASALTIDDGGVRGLSRWPPPGRHRWALRTSWCVHQEGLRNRNCPSRSP